MTLNRQKIQRTAPKNIRYKREQRRDKNKIRRVLRSSGLVEAQKYASQHELGSYLRGLVRE